MKNAFEFTNEWFKSTAEKNFAWLLPQLKPKRILEVGSYEGASTCFMIQFLADEFPIEICCIDSWLGGVEHQADDMSLVEARFKKNTHIASQKVAHTVCLSMHKGFSDKELASLLVSGGAGTFDFIYIDGSHQATDVILDALLSFRLLRRGGVIGFDDYTWGMEDILMSPKLAIDSFINIYSRKLRIINLNTAQIYVQKLAD